MAAAAVMAWRQRQRNQWQWHGIANQCWRQRRSGESVIVIEMA